MDAYYDAIRWLPKSMEVLLQKLPESEASQVTEIRLRSERALCVCNGVKEFYFCSDGRTVTKPDQAFQVTHQAISTCFLALCRYSIHSHARSLENGYLTLPGGHRAGICGSAFYMDDGKFSVQNITSINLRIARTNLIVSNNLLQSCLCNTKNGLIFAGEPGSGKTTLLRTAIQMLSDAGAQVSVVDERGELLPVGSQGFGSPPPFRCDVLSGYPKHIGMQHALRGLAPDYIVCDEVGALEDVAAIEQAANAGVKLVVSIHARNLSGLERRPQYKALLRTGAFDQLIFLDGRQRPGQIREVCNVSNEF